MPVLSIVGQLLAALQTFPLHAANTCNGRKAVASQTIAAIVDFCCKRAVAGSDGDLEDGHGASIQHARTDQEVVPTLSASNPMPGIGAGQAIPFAPPRRAAFRGSGLAAV